MPLYQYTALDAGGSEMKGKIEAASERVANQRLREQGLRPFELKETKGKDGAGSKGGFGKRKIKLPEISTFTRQIATLIDAGLPLLRALNILSDQTENPALKDVISAISTDIQGGASFSEALQKHPHVFSKLYINMVKAGEIGGVLEVVLDRLATFAEKDMELRTKIKGALTYPAIMGLVATGVVVFLLIFVIPTFVKMFNDVGLALPLPTQIVIAASDFLTNYWYVILGAIGVLVFAFKHANKTDAGKLKIDAMKLKVPVFGELNRKVATARFTRTLSTLIASGVPILQALDIVREVAGNEVIAQAMTKVSASITEGETISKPLHEAKVFAPMVTHMIAVGEETGALETMLSKIADQYEMIVDETVSALSSMIEPIMIVFMGATVGLIVTALFFPMFDLVDVVGH